jgi:hypothetical protein
MNNFLLVDSEIRYNLSDSDRTHRGVARFLVVYEYEKCGQSIKETLDKRKIFHCSMDDFYAENARQLQEVVLRNALERNLPHIVGENDKT